MADQSAFPPGVYAKSKTSPTGKQIAQVSLRWADFRAYCDANVEASGYITFGISTKANGPDKNGNDLSMWKCTRPGGREGHVGAVRYSERLPSVPAAQPPKPPLACNTGGAGLPDDGAGGELPF